MTNVNVVAKQLAELGGSTPGGLKIGFIDSAGKAAQNDTWTVTNAEAVYVVAAFLDSTGVVDAATISTNVVTLTVNQTGATSAVIVYR